MLDQLLGIFRNTFSESIRQPIVLVVLAITALALVLANPLSAFTMESDQRMLIDMGLATVFLCGGLLAAFIATGVLTREIENRTALTVVSKPVGRPMFVIGKFLGVAAAMLLCTVAMNLIFLLVEQHTVLETVRDPIHVPVIVFGVGAILIGLGAATWCNYFYGMNFTSMMICTATPLLLIGYVLSLLFTPSFTFYPQGQFFRTFQPDLLKAIAVMTMAIMVLVAVAVAASARLGQIMTLVITLGVFLLGLLSDWLLGRRVEGIREIWLERARSRGLTEETEVIREFTLVTGEVQRSPIPEIVDVPTVPLTELAEGGERLAMFGWQLIYGLVPNFQVLWLSDALTQDRLIPMSYVWNSLIYGSTYVIAALALAVFLFQRREVG